MPKVPGVTKDHSKQRVETHLRRRRLPVCVVGSQVHKSQALRGRGLCGKECALRFGESPSHNFLGPCHPHDLRSSHPLCAQVKQWLTSRLVNVEVAQNHVHRMAEDSEG